MEFLHELLTEIVDLAIIAFELMGVSVLLIAGLRGIYSYFTRNPLTRLNLAKGMAMGLEFKLGSEILRTVVVRDFSEIAIVAGIIALRAALTFLIHWEIKNEEAHHELHTTITNQANTDEENRYRSFVNKNEENNADQQETQEESKVIKWNNINLK